MECNVNVKVQSNGIGCTQNNGMPKIRVCKISHHRKEVLIFVFV